MKTIHFLGASNGLRLTKTFSKNDHGELLKDSYPMLKNFTSFSENVTTLEDFLAAIKRHANQGHCLLKGQLDRPLVKESRAGHTDSDQPTDWLVLDNDHLVDLEPQALMDLIGLGAVDYIIQYSASAGIEP